MLLEKACFSNKRLYGQGMGCVLWICWYPLAVSLTWYPDEIEQTFAIFRTYSAFSPAAPMDHKNIGTRMAPTTFCGYNLSGSHIFFLQKVSEKVWFLFWPWVSDFVLFSFLELEQMILHCGSRRFIEKIQICTKLISLSQTAFHWEMQKSLAGKLRIAELENSHLLVKSQLYIYQSQTNLNSVYKCDGRSYHKPIYIFVFTKNVLFALPSRPECDKYILIFEY